MAASSSDLSTIRQTIRAHYLADEYQCLETLIGRHGLSSAERAAIECDAVALVDAVRASGRKSLMDVFMAEYGLTTEEGVALMCLAEALLRVPDVTTISALIEDKIAPHQWQQHLGQAESALINASTWGLLLSARVLKVEETALRVSLRGLVKRLGEPVIRKAVAQAMKELGQQFVLGQDMAEAIRQGSDWRKRGYEYSFDMLGEAASNEQDAERYFLAYADAITALTPACQGSDIADNPGISIKLSALYSRYEILQDQQVMQILVPRVRSLALLAKSANMGLNIDAEEADRLDLSLDVIEAVLGDPALAGWHGFGVVVQAYSQRASHVLDWLYALARHYDRRIMVRLVKGAYWDSEIKRAQTLGLDGFPIFTRKAATDISWIACAKQLFTMQDRIYPQFASHNAHSLSAILALAPAGAHYEFQRLHGMGEILHDMVHDQYQTRCRIYAPVGSHEDLLAYLVRRLLENGANSSFVHQMSDTALPASALVTDPFACLPRIRDHAHHRGLDHPVALFGKSRCNAMGFDVTDRVTQEKLITSMAPYMKDVRGAYDIADSDAAAVKAAMKNLARDGILNTDARCQALLRAADLYEQHHGELLAILQKEAGKTILDAIGELREAVDFLRYYATEAARQSESPEPAGIFLCISPWNFPLAIFTGQIAAALAMGNRVVAKPAEQTPAIARRAVALLHQAGFPTNMLQLLYGDGAAIGGQLLSDKRINGVCFTGSTETAQIIHRQMATHLAPSAALIAETGGLNAMVVDSTALPEQVVRDVLVSGFQSAGQRCSALRMLYVQEDIADKILTMLRSAMDGLVVGDPADWATDVGPVIDADAKATIREHINHWQAKGGLLHQLATPDNGHFIGPALIQVGGIDDLEKEVFGPVVHVTTFKAVEYDQVLRDINQAGYGLTFGLHSRLDDRIAQSCARMRVGNIYVNRNQIGAIVGSQPFGGEGLSGTGPKAGGPNYLPLFSRQCLADSGGAEGQLPEGRRLTIDEIEEALRALPDGGEMVGDPVLMPGPTGEQNRLFHYTKAPVLMLVQQDANLCDCWNKLQDVKTSILVIADMPPVLPETIDKERITVLEGQVNPADLALIQEFSAVISLLPEACNRAIRLSLAARTGPILPLITGLPGLTRLLAERHVSIDITATGGNASLLSAAE